MAKPCGHESAVDGCRICHLYETRPDYRAHWDSMDVEVVGRLGILNIPKPEDQPCVHLGGPTGEQVPCITCIGTRLKSFKCTVHTQCTLAKPAEGIQCCKTCPDYVPNIVYNMPPPVKPTELHLPRLPANMANQAIARPNSATRRPGCAGKALQVPTQPAQQATPCKVHGNPPKQLPKWQYGITTCPQRYDEVLLTTLRSLGKAGFTYPSVFVDGCTSIIRKEPTTHEQVEELSHTVVFRSVNLGIVGNWILALWQLYLENPNADRFALFQDDVLAYRNLRDYLDRQPMPDKGVYLNLITQYENDPMVKGQPVGWYDGSSYAPGNPKKRDHQGGRGACGLVFSRQGVIDLLSSPGVVQKPLDPQLGKTKVDGMVVNAMNKLGYRETVHNPTLLYHTGNISTHTLPNIYPPATTWLGEEFDARTLLGDGVYGRFTGD